VTTTESRPSTWSVGGVAGPAAEWLEPLIRVTALVVVAEALLLRGATRVFIHIPGLDVTNGVLGRITDLARLAFRMAVPLTFVLLVMLTASLWVSHSGRASALAVGAFLAVVAAGRFEVLRPGANLVALGLVAAVAVVSVAGLELQARIPIAAWSAAFLMMGFVQLLDQRAADGVGVISLPWLGGLAEVVALVALVTAPLILRDRLGRVDWVVGVGIATLLVVALLNAEGQSAARILLLWNLGWSGGYPVIVYAIAIGSLVMTVAALVRRHRIRPAAALMFMSAAGFGLFSSYQTALLVAGLVLICAPSEPAASGQPVADVTGRLNSG
jgi:hypothetical protein